MQWLYEQVIALWYAITAWAEDLANAVEDLKALIVAWAVWARDSATSWARIQIADLGNALWAAWKQIGYAITQVRDYINARVDDLLKYISYIKGELLAWALVQLASLRTWVSDFVKWLSGTFYTALEVVRAWVDEILQTYLWPLWKWFSFWADRLSIFTNDALAMLQHFFSSLYSFLRLLVDDPVGVIAAILGTFLLDFIGELLATAMGSVKEELPPERRFGKYADKAISDSGLSPDEAEGPAPAGR
jgi:hypothetical protein